MCDICSLSAGDMAGKALLRVGTIYTKYLKDAEKGMAAFEAVRDASIRRLRPILLTSLTTSMGLLPIMLETSTQARFLVPMAISLGFGVLFSTLVILLLVPSLYLIREDAIAILRVALGRKAADSASPDLGAAKGPA